MLNIGDFQDLSRQAVIDAAIPSVAKEFKAEMARFRKEAMGIGLAKQLASEALNQAKAIGCFGIANEFVSAEKSQRQMLSKLTAVNSIGIDASAIMRFENYLPSIRSLGLDHSLFADALKVQGEIDRQFRSIHALMTPVIDQKYIENIVGPGFLSESQLSEIAFEYDELTISGSIPGTEINRGSQLDKNESYEVETRSSSSKSSLRSVESDINGKPVRRKRRFASTDEMISIVEEEFLMLLVQHDWSTGCRDQFSSDAFALFKQIEFAINSMKSDHSLIASAFQIVMNYLKTLRVILCEKGRVLH